MPLGKLVAYWLTSALTLNICKVMSSYAQLFTLFTALFCNIMTLYPRSTKGAITKQYREKGTLTMINLKTAVLAIAAASLLAYSSKNGSAAWI